MPLFISATCIATKARTWPASQLPSTVGRNWNICFLSSRAGTALTAEAVLSVQCNAQGCEAMRCPAMTGEARRCDQCSRLKSSYELHFEGLSHFSSSVERLVQIQDVNLRI